MLSIFMLPRRHAQTNLRGIHVHVPPLLFVSSPRDLNQGRTKVTPHFRGPTHRHCVVTAALVAIHIRRLVAAVTQQPSRARTCIGAYCICIKRSDGTIMYTLYTYTTCLGDHMCSTVWCSFFRRCPTITGKRLPCRAFASVVTQPRQPTMWFHKRKLLLRVPVPTKVTPIME